MLKKESCCVSCKKAAKELNVKRLSRCSGCKIVRYCSEKCQRTNFKNHKLVCRQINSTTVELQKMENELRKSKFDRLKGFYITSKNPLSSKYYKYKFALTRLVWFLAQDTDSYEGVEKVKDSLIELLQLDINLGMYVCN